MAREFGSMPVPCGNAADAGTAHDPSNGQFTSGGGAGVSNVSKGIAKHTTETESAAKSFPKGSKVKANRAGAEAREVTGHNGNMLELSDGSTIHHTKAVKA